MKSILYVGATLMIGASIYGFVDYKQTQNKKEFKEMYAEEKTPVVITGDKTTEPVVEKVSGKTVAVNNKKVETKKQDSEEEVIVAVKPIAEDEKIGTKETKEIGSSSVDVKTSKESGVEKKVKKKKKISTKLFSRGALDERYIEPKEKVVAPKEETKITKDKEQ